MHLNHTLKTILLLFMGSLTPLAAQNQTTMKHQNDPSTSGQVIKGGKLLYSEISINVPAKKVWEIFSDFGRYSEWNPFIRSLKGSVIEDSTIEVFLQPPGNKGMTFTPKVLRFETEKEFRWIGKFLIPRLFDGEHTFLLKDNGDGTCTFVQYERFRGILVPFLKKMLNEGTRSGFEQMNAALKKRCEEPGS